MHDRDLLLSTGWKLVSFLPSKPAPNSICGMEQLPKFPMVELVDVATASAAEEVADAVSEASVALAVTVTVT